MLKRLFLLIPLFLIISACAPGLAKQPAALPFIVTLTTPPPDFPAVASTPAATLAAETALPSETAIPLSPTPTEFSAPTLMATPTPFDLSPTASQTAPAISTTPAPTETYIPYLATATETLLPPLELPTEQSRPPALLGWTGLPTYPADSDPGLLFRMDYDPDLWAQTAGNFGDIVLANRQIPYCTITPWTGRGLPVDWKVVHEFRNIGSAAFDVNSVTAQGVLKFVSYVGGDHHVLTGFQVTFDTQSDACLQAAENVFGTLRSYAAVPTATPATSPTP